MTAARADEGRTFHAPDGIEIVPFVLPGLAHLSFVEGRIPPRPDSYPVHMHGALEQITYVLAGEIGVTTHDPATGETAAFTATAGDAFVTLPGQTLAYTNTAHETARVLFVCAPAYPPDDSDTRLVTNHHAPDTAERAWLLARHRAAVAVFAGIVGGRVRQWSDTPPPPQSGQ